MEELTINNKKHKDGNFDFLQLGIYVFLVLQGIVISQFLFIILPIKFTWMITLFILKGAKPYHFFIALNIVADLLSSVWLQFFTIAVLTWFLVKYRFYNITIIDQGEYNAGFRYIKKDQQELAVFYPTTDTGESAMWAQYSDLFKNLYDFVFIDPLKPRLVPLSIFKFLISYVAKMRMPAFADAKLEIVNPQINNFSVFIFSHGLSSNMTSHSSYCSWLASHGYIVISLQHSQDLIRFPYDQELVRRKELLSKLMFISKNQDLQRRTEQMEDVYTELISGRLLHRIFPEGNDLQVTDIHFCGHSFGGATCMETVAKLSRKKVPLTMVREIIAIDPWVYPLSESTLNHHFDQRITVINSETFLDFLPPEFKMKENMRRIKTNNLRNFSGFVLMGTDHIFCTDFIFVCGNGIQLFAQILNYRQSLTFFSMLETITMLSVEKKSSQDILEVCSQKFNDSKLKEKNICVVEEIRCDMA